MKELERRALLGDKQAQEECTEKGIVLPCWRCGEGAEVKQVSNVGRPLYAVSCKNHYCGAYGCAHRTENEAILYWNTRTAPPIGRCKDCKHKKIFRVLFIAILMNAHETKTVFAVSLNQGRKLRNEKTFSKTIYQAVYGCWV